MPCHVVKLWFLWRLTQKKFFINNYWIWIVFLRQAFSYQETGRLSQLMSSFIFNEIWIESDCLHRIMIDLLLLLMKLYCLGTSIYMIFLKHVLFYMMWSTILQISVRVLWHHLLGRTKINLIAQLISERILPALMIIFKRYTILLKWRLLGACEAFIKRFSS